MLDANVLYSIVVTDLVMELASTGLFRARWSEDVHAEWMRNVEKDRPDLPAAAIEKRRRAMDRAIPNALVTGYETLIDGLVLPDPDFPEVNLAAHSIEVQHPDEFLNHQRTLNEALFLTCVKAVRARLKNPKHSPQGYIDNLRSCQLQVIAAELEQVKALI